MPSPPVPAAAWLRALDALGVSLCAADASRPDLPLVHVSPAFEVTTGYPADEVLGRNCRFLQDGLGEQPEVEELRRALAEQRAVTVVLRNRRRDGTVFLNELSLAPLRDERGTLTHYLAVQRDVTAQADQRELARQLRRDLLPRRLPSAPGLDVAVRYLASSDEVGGVVSGDFVDLFASVDPARGVVWNLAVGDVQGRGPAAAVHTTAVRTALKAVTTHSAGPAAGLRALNEVLLDELSDRFVTAGLVQLEVDGDGLLARLALAGHPQPLLLGRDGAVTAVGRPGDLLGVFPSGEAHDVELALPAGAALVLYTDGVTEAGPARDQFGVERLERVVRALRGASSAELAEGVLRAVAAHCPTVEDDAAVVVVQPAGTGTAGPGGTASGTAPSD